MELPLQPLKNNTHTKTPKTKTVYLQLKNMETLGFWICDTSKVSWSNRATAGREANTGPSPGCLTQEHHPELGHAHHGRDAEVCEGWRDKQLRGTGRGRSMGDNLPTSSIFLILFNQKNKTGLILAIGQTFGSPEQSWKYITQEPRRKKLTFLAKQWLSSF